MIFKATALAGAFLIEIERIVDNRGFFGRTFCRKEFQANGLNPDLVQASISFNRKKGSLRGMHYQIRPHAETKVVRCTRGSVYDVIVDLRRDSATYRRWIAVELTAENRRMIYIPEDFAHGFQTLMDNTEVLYCMSEYYHPKYARGFRWDDPAVGIRWPSAHRILSVKDANYPDFNP